ncbi:MAG: FitA-like ribbon-helix-helix domain-containing protein [Spirochaetota bacterium]
MPQYTIRNVPEALDRELRERARRRGVSLNDAAIDAIRRGLGVVESGETYDDMDDLVGTWKADREFDRAVSEQDTVDTEAWR